MAETRWVGRGKVTVVLSVPVAWIRIDESTLRLEVRQFIFAESRLGCGLELCPLKAVIGIGSRRSRVCSPECAG